ncbi:MAG: sugar ABC transporter ATP-binding protein [Spirochaetia bacterium]
METILECRGVSKSFGGVTAVKNVTFTVGASEVHALVGENGAGKSTLIKMISGVLTPDSGEILYEGSKVSIDSPRKAQEIGISAVYQEPMIYPELRVLENIFLGREMKKRLGGIDWTQEDRKARELFDSLGISTDIMADRMGNLSVGLQQQVLIAKALAYDARVIIFDEPTAILTQHETQRLFSIIAKLRERRVGVVYISHRLEEIFALTDRVTVMRDGEVVGEFPTREVDSRKIISLMAGKLLVEEVPHAGKKSQTPILSVRSLSLAGWFSDISFDVFQGEILGFSGLVGSGRSEVAQSIFGVLRPDSGEILLDGRRVSFSSAEEAMRHGVAYLPEDRKVQGLFPILSTAYNITITRLSDIASPLGGVDRYRERDIGEAYIRDLSIKTPGLDSKIYSLSGGNQQKVVVAKWLGVNPRIFILDEPTRGIDVSAKSEIHHMIARLAEQGMAVLIISSELPEILKLCDRVIVMHEGAITGVFEGEEITSENLLGAAIGERVTPARGGEK